MWCPSHPLTIENREENIASLVQMRQWASTGGLMVRKCHLCYRLASVRSKYKLPPLSEEFLCWGARILSLKEHVVPYRMQGCSFVSVLSKEAKVLQQKGKSPSAVLGAYPVGTCR